jgi:hypothetical protein
MLPGFSNGHLLTGTTKFIPVNFQILFKLAGFNLVKGKNWHSSEAVYLRSFMEFYTNIA